MQFLEVHHEEIRDLLGDPSGSGKPLAGGLPLRESGAGAVAVAGAATRRVESAEDALSLLRHGVAARATGKRIWGFGMRSFFFVEK